MTAPVMTNLDHRSDTTGLGVLHGELLCEAVDIHPGERVLDVTAGDQATAIAAARRGADLTVSDVARSETLPYHDDTFDVVLSSFGTMFASDPQRLADELVRVGRPGGRIGLVSWASTSLIGEALHVTVEHLGDPAGVLPALEWDSADRVRELFGNRINALRVEIRALTFRHRYPEHMVAWFRTSFEPTRAALACLDDERRGRLAADLLKIASRYNRADDGTLVAPSDYLEIVAVIR